MGARTQPTETAILHFDLRHAGDRTEFWIATGRGTHPLKPHTPATRAQHRTLNGALALLPDEDLNRITHYAEDVELPSDVARLIRVHFPLDGPLPGLAAVAIHVPREARRRNRERRGAQGIGHRTLAEYGVADLGSDALETSLDADDLKTPLDVAKAIVFHHPSLASRDPDTAARVMDDHIDRAPGLMEFATVIAEQGPATRDGGWATISPSVDGDGNPYQYDQSAGWTKQGDVYHYDLSEKTTGAEGYVPLRSALRTVPDDEALQNHKWSVNAGAAAQSRHVYTAQAPPQPPAAAAADGYSFTVNNKTPGHGVDVNHNTLRYDPATAAFSIGALNTYLRTLSAYVQFQDAKGTPITPPEWDEVWDGFLDHPDADKYFLTTASAVNNIMGIPMPFFTDPTILGFTWPDNATQADLLLGGIGTAHWDGDVATVGLIATGIFQYGIPVMFLAAGAAIESSAWYKKFTEDKEFMYALYVVAAFLAAALDATYATIAGVKRALSVLASAIAGIIVSRGLSALAAWIFVKITAAEAEDAVPFAGWAARVINMAVTAAQIAETTVEVLMSPATYRITVQRRLHARITVHPDPIHGTTLADAIWPTEADHWLAAVQYRDGTNYTQTGPLPTGADADQPVIVAFDDLPAGSQLQVTFGVYSDTDWLAGRWTSAWVDALLPQGQTSLAIEGAIQENLVPLTPQTQYRYRQKIAWDGTAHVWHTGDQPQQTAADLDPSNIGDNLSKLVNVTLNDKAYMLGYCWHASGQSVPLCGSTKPYSGQIHTFASMSTLADPQRGYKYSECGFGGQPYLLYDQFGPAPLFDLAAAAEGDLDAGGAPSAAIRDAFAAARYALPDAAQIIVVTKTAEWTIGWDADPAYVIRRVTEDLQVFPYPQPPYSPNNFYVEPVAVGTGDDKTTEYYLRRVTLDETTPFVVDQPDRQAFGKFVIPHMDAFAVHPAGYVVAASWMDSKIQILKLPDAPTRDEDAEPALILSGLGVRQGLLHGPIALTVTADGRILVLETENERIQALDINGNPVPCFDGPPVTGLHAKAATSVPDLDAGRASEPLRTAFREAGVALSERYTITDGQDVYGLARDDGELDVTRQGAALGRSWTIADTAGGVEYAVSTADDGSLPVSRDGHELFRLDAGDADALNRAAVSAAIVAEFRDRGGVTLPAQADCEVIGDGYRLDASTYSADLALGRVSDTLRAAFLRDRRITLAGDAVVHSTVTVTVRQAGKQWILTDAISARSFKITPDAGDLSTLTAVSYDPTMRLHRPDPAAKVTYLDMANEMKGYLFVLAYTGAGSRPSDYYVDIYRPDGEWLSRTPDFAIDPDATPMNAAKLIVDQWRTMFTLNFEHYQGPKGTEPSVSQWVPSTPTG